VRYFYLIAGLVIMNILFVFIISKAGLYINK